MTTNIGVNSIADLLDTRFSSVLCSELDFSKLNSALQADLRFWEDQVRSALAAIAETSVDRARVWGSSAVAEFEELDEFGKPSGQKYLMGNTSNFPLRRYAVALGWTSLWFATHKASEMAEKVLAMQRGANELEIKLMKEAIYFHENKSVKDKLVDNTDLSVKRWINADNSLIPNSPTSGSAFDGATHTHFLTTATQNTVVASDLERLVETVREHNVGTPALFINEANTSTLMALGTSGSFVPLSAPVINYVATDSTIQKLDINTDPADRMVGYFGPNYTPVYTKPWAIRDFYVCLALGGAEKPLVRRIHKVPALQGLHLESENDNFPLHAQSYALIVGYGCWNRLAGAVLSVDSVYTDPTI